MRALRLFLLTVLVAALLAGTAYGAGRAYRHLGDESASSSPTSTGEPAPTESPSETPETSAPVEPAAPPEPEKPAAVLEPGARGERVRELQHRLFQMAWLPETTTGRYD